VEDDMTIIDVWIQHPTAAFLRQPMFASLLRGRGMDPSAFPDPVPDSFTLSAVPVAADWIRATGRFDEDLRPEEAGADMDGTPLG
jgi:hypothetical protein